MISTLFWGVLYIVAWFVVGHFVVGFSEGIMNEREPENRVLYMALVWPAVLFALCAASLVERAGSVYDWAFKLANRKKEAADGSPAADSSNLSPAPKLRLEPSDGDGPGQTATG